MIAALLLPAGKEDTTTLHGYSLLVTVVVVPALFYLTLGVGLCFVPSSNKIMHKIGITAFITAAIIALVTGVAAIGLYDFSVAVVFLFIAVFFVVAALVLEGINKIKSQSTTAAPNAISDIKAWNQLLDEKIITEEEFMAKRNEILKINVTTNEKAVK